MKKCEQSGSLGNGPGATVLTCQLEIGHEGKHVAGGTSWGRGPSVKPDAKAARSSRRRTSAQSVSGDVSRTVIANIKSLRVVRGMSEQDLSARLAAIGKPIAVSVLGRIANGTRSVTVDDLVSFASVFGVRPAEMLEPMDALPFTAEVVAEMVARGWKPPE